MHYQRLEAQAERAADRFMRGERGLGASLERSAPATLPLAGASGSPLEPRLRTEFESAFDADFSAVRLHRGEAADRLARRMGASALAAGNHILFAEGGFSMRRLAHELAHTLQQTAECGGAERLRVRPLQGTGYLQLDPNPQEESPIAQPYTLPAAASFEKIAQWHKDANPGNELLDNIIEKTRKNLSALPQKDQQEEYWDTLDAATPGNVTGVIQEEKKQQMFCLLIDWLKFKGRFKAAAGLVEKLPDYRTALFDTRIYAALIARDLGWLDSIWESHGFFQPYRPSRFVDTYYDYLFATTSDIPALGSQTDFRKAADDFIAKAGKGGGTGNLVEAEPAYYAVWAVREADKLRVGKLQEIVNAVAPGVASSHLTPEQRFQVADRLREWAKGLSAGQGLEGKPVLLRRIFFKLAAELQQAANMACQYWSAVGTAIIALRKGTEMEGLGDVRVLLVKELAKKEYTSFHEQIFKPLQALLALGEDGNPLPPPAYEKARREASKQIRSSARESFEGKLKRSAKDIAREKQKPDIGPLVAYGIMLNTAGLLVELLDRYDQKQDEAFGKANVYPAQDKNIPAPDLRIRHRLVLARFLWNMGRLFGWADVEELADQVIAARQDRQKSSFLALLGDWREEEDVPVGRLFDDFDANAELSGWAPLRVRDLHRFFQAEYYRRLNQVIERKLGEAYDLAGRPIVKAANLEVLAGLPRPKRFEMPSEDVERAIRSEDTRRIGDLILSHPKTVKLFAEQKAIAPVIRPLTPNTIDAQRVFIWFLPSFDALIQRLRKVEAFNLLVRDAPGFVKAQGWKEGEPHSVEPVKSLSDMEWLGYFSEPAGLGEKNRDPAIGREAAPIRQTLEEEYRAEREKLITNLRKASIRDRRERGKGQIVPLLDGFSPYRALDKVDAPTGVEGNKDPKGKTDTHKLYSVQVPGIVSGLIFQIANATEPRSEQAMHHAALMLQLADKLLENLGVNVKLEIATLFMPHLLRAFKTLETGREALPGFLSAEENADADWIASRLQKLKTLEEKFRAKQAKEQLKFGVMGLKSEEGTQVLRGVGHGFVIKANEEDPFTITDAKTGWQISWKLLSIEQDFVYYPKLGDKEAELWSLDANGEPNGSLARTEKLATVLINGQKWILTGKDTDKLDMLTFAVTMEAIKRQLDDLAQLIQQFGELTMDVLEMVPGLQPIIAARMVMAIFAFVASPEFEEIKKTITENPEKVLGELVDKLTAFVDPNSVWEYILFADSSYLNRLHGKPVKKEPKLKKGGVATRLMAVLKRLFNFSEEVVGDLARYQTWMRWQAEKVEMFVQQHPALNAVLHFIALYFDQIVTFGEKLAEYLFGKPEEKADKQADMKKGLAEWPENVHGMVLRVADLQLPAEVLPMGDLAEALFELTVSRLPGKYKLGGNVVLFLLRLIGKEQEVFDYLAAQIPKEMNPNTYWQKGIQKPINEKLDTAGKEFARELFGFMESTLKTLQTFEDESKLFAKFKANVDANFAEKRTQENEAKKKQTQQPYGWRMGMSSLDAAPPKGPGAGLPPVLRQPNEAWFGQDFSHVRLHRDAGSAAYTQSVAAAAVTAGSHIYLNPSVDFASSMGQHVLRHELAHVVQQTGPRPTGHTWPATPSPAPVGGGLSFNPRLESQAEAAALKPGASLMAGPGAGLQPMSLTDIASRFLTDITKTVDLETQHALGDAARADKIPPSINPKLKGFADSYDTALNKALTADKPFDSVLKEIRDHLSDKATATGSRGKEVKDAIRNAILDSIRETGKEKQKDGSEKPTYKLDKGHLEVSLSRRVLGIAGIDMVFDIEEESEKAALKVKGLKVKYVHLAVIHANSPLWVLVKKANPKIDDKFLPILRGVLFDEGVSVGIWEKASYALTPGIIAKAQAIIDGKITGSLDTSQLPTVADYTSTDPIGPSSQIGLRLGTYDAATQSGPDRDSHHTTQFLLVEFFSNTATVLAFPELAKHPDWFPGVEPESKGKAPVETIKGDTKLQVGVQLVHRGGPMPCILLSKPAHRFPGLHMTPTPDDLKDGHSTQADVVKSRFESALGKFHPLARPGYNEPQYKSLGTKAEVQDAIYKATIQTYHSVWEARMKNNLKLALAGPERAYYNALADLKHGGNSGGRMTPDMALKVWAKAVSHNNTEMSKYGWK